ncbi:DUF2505 domain-containing protein [Rhodococcoides corynebacterioides]|uniref:DUF2505 domain-containing protein n=1 Tax=Rhodococcoides corynebacterioides TaxID=53972 RepID=UPI003F80BFDD
MPRKFDHTVPSPLSAAQVHAALTTEVYWQARLDAIGGPKATLDEVVVKGDSPDARTVRAAMTQAIAEEFLPSALTSIRSGDLVIHRVESWGSLDAQGSAGRFEAKVEGAPATITGTLTLASTESGCTMTATGAAEVKVPFIGGKIESAVIEHILALIDAEQEFTDTWAPEHT